MQGILPIILYIVAAALLIVLALGLINLTRKDAKQASRSNILMRWRIGLQALAVGVIVVMGFVAGAINFG